jgi:hypothetical protein
MNDLGSKPAEVRHEDEELASRARRALRRSGESSWEAAECFVELSRRGWTQTRIGKECGASQSSVSRFIACAEKYAVPHNRPPFWDVYKHCHASENSGTTEWFTPAVILDAVRECLGGAIDLDPATTPDNPTGATHFFTAKDDGLSRPWDWPTLVNPPYGGVTPDWCKKIHDEAQRGAVILALLPCGARFSTGYWQERILHERLAAVCFHRGRVKFVAEGGERPGNPYDSAIYGFNASPRKFARAFVPLGTVLEISRVTHGPAV